MIFSKNTLMFRKINDFAKTTCPVLYKLDKIFTAVKLK